MKDDRFLHPFLMYQRTSGVRFACFRIRGGNEACSTRARKTWRKKLYRTYRWVKD